MKVSQNLKRQKMYSRDYISIGTLGFAQVGNSQYESKLNVEKKVINAFYKREDLKVPKEFEEIALFYWKTCPHDFGSYWDFQLIYNRHIVDSLEESEKEKGQRFYEWVNKCETAMFNNEEMLLDLMDKLYRKTVTMEIIHRNIEKNYTSLKAV